MLLKVIRFLADLHLALGAGLNLVAAQLEEAPFAGDYAGGDR